jgi:hypothetical protein
MLHQIAAIAETCDRHSAWRKVDVEPGLHATIKLQTTLPVFCMVQDHYFCFMFTLTSRCMSDTTHFSLRRHASMHGHTVTAS